METRAGSTQYLGIGPAYRLLELFGKALYPEAEKGFPRSPSNFPVIDDLSEQTWKQDKLLISEEHNKLVLAIHSFPESRLNKQTESKNRWTYSQLLTGVMVHDAYHTGQIQLMKRLYQSLVLKKSNP